MELLIVIVVLGVLAGVALPVYSGFVDRAKKAEAVGMLDAVRSSEMRYFAEFETYTQTLTALDYDPNDELGGQSHRYTYVGVDGSTTAFRVNACLAADCSDVNDPVAKATETEVTML
ncbi:MAG: Tfp pilus assembly protein PilE [Candidatus Omnitrophota bacterium]|jgi:Tfp pilus assembly protein PilE